MTITQLKLLDLYNIDITHIADRLIAEEVEKRQQKQLQKFRESI